MNEILIVFLCFDVYLLLITHKLLLICDCKLLQILLFFLRLKVMSKIVSAGFNAKTKAWTFEAKDKAIRPEAKAIKVGLEAPQSLTSTSTSLSLNELYHASHLWYPPFYTSPMASSALQH